MAKRKPGISLLDLVVVLIILGILAAIAVPNYWTAKTRSGICTLNAALRDAAIGLNAYFVDHGAYPPPADDNGNILAGTGALSGYIPTHILPYTTYSGPSPAFDEPCQETDWSTIPEEVYPSFRGETYRYAVTPGGCFILASNGPDEELDIDLQVYVDPEKGNCDWEYFLWEMGGNRLLYDPSNGTFSNGDIVRLE